MHNKISHRFIKAESKSKSLLLHSHTGLGDHIICNGMAHAFADTYDKVYLIHIKMFGDSIRALYRGHHKIELIEFPDIDVTKNAMGEVRKAASDRNAELLSVADPLLYYPQRLLVNNKGDIIQMHIATNFERQFYEIAGLPFCYRYTRAVMPESTESSRKLLQDLTAGEDFVLIHNASSQSEGYPIALDQVTKHPNLRRVYVKPGHTNNIFDYVDLIKRATEIHTVGSSFYCIVDSMFNQTTAKLFFHDLVMKHETQINTVWNEFKWNVVSYNARF